jgi:tRNA pseudouridine38-40 synthase
LSPTRIALCLQYDGGYFCGWQRQPVHTSVQQVLDEAITALDPLPAGVKNIANAKSGRSVAAGRTDAGVHAAGQVVHFDCHGPIPAQRWAAALNGRLPNSIRVRAASAAASQWHACYSASYRRYRYTIYNGRRPNLFLAPYSWHRYQWRLEEAPMALALSELIGEHDFRAFQRAGSHRAHARTTVQEVDLQRDGDILSLEIQATGFLYGMVRLLVGQLVALGEGRLGIAQFRQRWREGRREEVKEAAPPQGLCLLRVGYSDQIFPEGAWYDCLPRYRLVTSDPPPEVDLALTPDVL